ncbi:urease accessory protein UreF [Euhalothece natronophila Z-M001]|uniref:Urease accessory protein UreF n=1 Tax=Euhalothece natronophila Z-M001 TaxID=522448 RepID=A0A5B8NMV6_9CHRO|nr:urease accessory UreF family protein [Euhalothece natronophila]QDZ39610.1 urease accessory protein UreF [Euhalothece natronophila Z-M001]
MVQSSQQLALLQLADSFFPSGTYTLSHGLETFVQTGEITSSQELRDMIELALWQKVGASELVALIHTHRASQQGNISAIAQIEQHLWSQTLVTTTRDSLLRSGRALLSVATPVWLDSQLEALSSRESPCYGLHPIIFAVVSRAARLEENDAALAYLHGFVTGIMGAAIRLGILGHIQAQQLRLELASTMEQVWEEAAQKELTEMGSFAPTLDIAQIKQANLTQRSFAN